MWAPWNSWLTLHESIQTGEGFSCATIFNQVWAELSDKFPELVAVWVRSFENCLGKMQSQWCISYRCHLGLQCRKLNSFSRSLEIAPRPHPLLCAGLGLWLQWGKPCMAHCCCWACGLGPESQSDRWPHQSGVSSLRTWICHEQQNLFMA